MIVLILLVFLCGLNISLFFEEWLTNILSSLLVISSLCLFPLLCRRFLIEYNSMFILDVTYCAIKVVLKKILGVSMSLRILLILSSRRLSVCVNI